MPAEKVPSRGVGFWPDSIVHGKRLSRIIGAQKPKILERWYACQFDARRIRHFEVAGTRGLERETVLRSFLTPLLSLLLAYLRTGENRYRDIYLDERLRYAPHSADVSIRRRFFGEVIPSDEEAILTQLHDCPELVSSLRTFLAGLHGPLSFPDSDHSVMLLALGDCLMNEVRVFLPARSRAAGVSLDMRMLYFSAAMHKNIDTREAVQFLSSSSADLVALSFLTYEGLPPYSLLLRDAHCLAGSEINERVSAILELMRVFMSELRERTEAPLLLHNASGLPLRGLRRYVPVLPANSRRRRRVLESLNESIRQLADEFPGTILIDEELIATKQGHRNCMRSAVPRDIARESFFHTSQFGEYLAEPYLEVINSYVILRKAKVVLVDFDETLWKGVMADGAVHQFKERQSLLVQLKNLGLLLVAVSKNNPNSVRWSEMILQPSDFTLVKINWNPKVQSIRETIHELDLGADTFVFIDDSITERELVRSEYPQIRTLDSADPLTWRALEHLLSFPNARATLEAKRRTELYREGAARRRAIDQSVDYPGLMASLNLKSRFGRALSKDLNRITELVHRTNQFNTTTIRYSRLQLQQFLSSTDHHVYVCELSDKHSSLGLVVVVIIERRGAEAVFDSFIMSCRAMGFCLEQHVLCLVLEAEKSATRFVGKFVPTDRNSPASKLFSDAGFTQLTETNWILYNGGPMPRAPAWFTVSGRSTLDCE